MSTEVAYGVVHCRVKEGELGCESLPLRPVPFSWFLLGFTATLEMVGEETSTQGRRVRARFGFRVRYPWPPANVAVAATVT